MMVNLNCSLLRQWLAAFAVTLSSTVAYCNMNWLTPMPNKMANQDIIPMADMPKLWILSITTISVSICSIPLGIAGHIWGRKPVLLTIGPIATFSFILLSYTRSLNVLYICCFINGITTAIPVLLGVTYIAETVSAEIRGTLASLFMSLYYAGGIYVDIVAYFIHDYALYLRLLALIPIAYTIILYFLPETPYYLVMHGKEQEAVNSLQWFTPSNTIETNNNKIIDLKKSIKNEFSWTHFFHKPQYRNALVMAISVEIFKNFGGQVPVMVYATQIFEIIIGSKSNRIDLIIAIILNVILCISPYISSFLSDSYARRPVILFTSNLSGIFYIIVAVYFYIHNGLFNEYETIHLWIIIFSLILAVTFSNAAMSILLPVVSAEYFITESRTLGSAISQTIGFLAGFGSLIIYQYINDYVGQYFNYILYSWICFCSSGVVYFFVRETSQKTLETIQMEGETEYSRI